MKTRRLITPAAETFPLSKAKAHLGRLLEQTECGGTVYILKGRKRFLLQLVPEVQPIPIRPPGYFEFDEEDVRLDAKFAKANVMPESNHE
jgi:hypothetical protein